MDTKKDNILKNESEEVDTLDNVENINLNLESNDEIDSSEKKTTVKKTKKRKIVGEDEDLIPFAWRHPLQATDKKMNSNYKQITKTEAERSLMVISQKE